MITASPDVICRFVWRCGSHFATLRRVITINEMAERENLVVPKLTNSGTVLSLDCSLNEMMFLIASASFL